MKLLFDFLPIILFFVAYKLASSRAEAAAAWATQHLGVIVAGGTVAATEAPVLVATLVAIAATVAQVGWLLARRRRVDPALWLSLALVVVMGGLTVWLHDATFIKWKPTLLYGAMMLALLLGRLVWHRNLLKSLLGQQIQLPEPVWARLLLWWIAFLALQAVLNLWVAFSFDTATWVNYKLFGAMGLLVLFTLAQGFYLARYMDDGAPSTSGSNTNGSNTGESNGSANGARPSGKP